ncbi:MAG: glycosyltransferase [Christensenellales bacterium]|jgi:glycosyltransferase involved in cell wall biosynthesis
MKKKTLLFVVDEMHTGGVSRALCDTLRNIDRRCFSVDVLILHKHGAMLKELPEDVTVLGGPSFFQAVDRPFAELKRSRDIKGLAYKLMLLAYMKSGLIRRKIKKERKKMLLQSYDVEIGYKDGFCTIFTALGDAKRKLTWIHGDYGVNNTAKNHMRLMGDALRGMDGIVAVSDRAAEQVQQVFGLNKRPRVIANPVDEKLIWARACEKPIEFPKGTRAILSVGRLCEAKAFDRLARVHKRLLDDGFAHKVFIVGEGPARAQLEALIHELGVQDSFLLLGYQENPYPYMRAADLYVLSSRHESFGLVVTEAQLLQIPVIATDVADVAQRLAPDGKTAYGLIAPNSEDGLYAALAQVLLNPQILGQYRENLKEFHYDNQIIFDQIQELLLL